MGDMALQCEIPHYWLLDNEHEVEVAIAHLKHKCALAVFDEIYNAKQPIVVETHIETWDNPMKASRFYKLHYRLTAVQTRDVVFSIPVFTYTNHEGKQEWKCPACAMINSIEATFCGEKHLSAAGCGRPRDKIRQEL